MHNIRHILFTAISLCIFLTGCNSEKESYTLVNPFIGTDFHGHTYPGATVPFGMVQLSPDTRRGNWDACAGYHYSDTTMYGFSHTHLSGTGCVDFGDVLFHPTIKAINGDDEGYIFEPLAFSHSDEVAEPGYYKVNLRDVGVVAELTATQHAGYHRYTFPRSETSKIIIDLAHSLDNERIDGLELTVTGSDEIQGKRVSSGWTPNQHVFFVAKFSKPFDEVKLISNGTALNVTSAAGDNIQAVCSYATSSGEQVNVKVGISFVSCENARENLEKEVGQASFDDVRDAAKIDWIKRLDKIQVEGGTAEQQAIFYTALYHSMLTPNVVSDVNGEYRNHNMQIDTVTTGHGLYSTLSLWDTFRAWHPLMTLIDENITVDAINSMLKIYETTGELPIWPLASGETGTMIGYHSVSVIADAYLKGITGFDVEKAFEAMKVSSNINRKGKEFYLKNGFIPADVNKESVSCLLEYAYDDWCIAQMAKELGQDADYEEYITRAKSYLNVFDGKTRFFRGKRLDGNWVSGFEPLEVSRDFTEANAWQYRFFTPHDIAGLVNLFGGKDSFINELDELFEQTSDYKGELQDITGLIGQYAHGNEPSHHVAYLYNYLGQPWKTQRRIRQIIDEMYSSAPDGIVGNEDCGQMSAWYIMSSMGLYPVCPGSGEYLLTTPLFEKVVLNLHNGRQISIKANDPDKNVYINKVLFNGKEVSNNYLTHQELMQGGELEFVLSSQPNKVRGISAENAPYSLTKKKAVSIPYVEEDLSLFIDKVKCSMGCATEGAVIKYTLDGSEPDENSASYSEPFYINDDLVVKSRAYKEGYEPSAIFSIHAEKAVFKKADRSQCSVPGVNYKYFEGLFTRASDMEKAAVKKSGKLTKPVLDEADIEDHYGFEFTGLLYAPVKGIYEFYTASDDGSVLVIGTDKVVDNDFSHGKITATGRIALESGYHFYKLLFFEDYEGQHLEMGWKIPGEDKFKEIEAEDLFLY